MSANKWAEKAHSSKYHEPKEHLAIDAVAKLLEGLSDAKTTAKAVTDLYAPHIDKDCSQYHASSKSTVNASLIPSCLYQGVYLYIARLRSGWLASIMHQSTKHTRFSRNFHAMFVPGQTRRVS